MIFKYSFIFCKNKKKSFHRKIFLKDIFVTKKCDIAIGKSRYKNSVQYMYCKNNMEI